MNPNNLLFWESNWRITIKINQSDVSKSGYWREFKFQINFGSVKPTVDFWPWVDNILKNFTIKNPY